MPILKQKKLLLITVLSATVLCSLPLLAQARGLVPCGGYQQDGTREPACTVKDAFVLIAKVTNWLIAVAGMYAVYELISGGFWLIISVGNEEAITKEKGRITSAVIGFIMVLMAFMFINTTVNFLLTRSFVTQDNPSCKLDLTNPTSYLEIKDYGKCSSVPDNTLHAK